MSLRSKITRRSSYVFLGNSTQSRKWQQTYSCFFLGGGAFRICFSLCSGRKLDFLLSILTWSSFSPYKQRRSLTMFKYLIKHVLKLLRDWTLNCALTDNIAHKIKIYFLIIIIINFTVNFLNNNTICSQQNCRCIEYVGILNYTEMRWKGFINMYLLHRALYLTLYCV